mmetsp:Transcript_1680/g.2410  ORF Transcript_1680/g.2410 Transcript_1680/m.2410 type:complete len:82 (-) Transcript_1680:3700-3945(-)
MKPINKQSADIFPLLYNKFKAFLQRGYIKLASSSTFITNLIDYFEVPKSDDIRVVFNGSSCGLNAVVYASSFWLPFSSSML